MKPDGVQRGLVGDIVGRFEKRGYKLVAMKTRMATKEILDEHYKDLVEKPFFPALRDYLLSGPVVSMCWAGKEAGESVVSACIFLAIHCGLLLNRSVVCIDLLLGVFCSLYR